MYGREELVQYKTHINCSFFKSYLAEEADKVMDATEARIKELENQLEDVQNTMATENVDLGMENHKLKERVKELEAVISKMETTTPKWISVKDMLPEEGEEVIVFYTSWKYEFQQVVFFEDGKFIDLEGRTLHPTHWMPLPSQPTTEDSSAIEKEK